MINKNEYQHNQNLALLIENSTTFIIKLSFNPPFPAIFIFFMNQSNPTSQHPHSLSKKHKKHLKKQDKKASTHAHSHNIFKQIQEQTIQKIPTSQTNIYEYLQQQMKMPARNNNKILRSITCGICYSKIYFKKQKFTSCPQCLNMFHQHCQKASELCFKCKETQETLKEQGLSTLKEQGISTLKEKEAGLKNIEQKIPLKQQQKKQCAISQPPRPAIPGPKKLSTSIQKIIFKNEPKRDIHVPSNTVQIRHGNLFCPKRLANYTGDLMQLSGIFYILDHKLLPILFQDLDQMFDAFPFFEMMEPLVRILLESKSKVTHKKFGFDSLIEQVDQIGGLMQLLSVMWPKIILELVIGEKNERILAFTSYLEDKYQSRKIKVKSSKQSLYVLVQLSHLVAESSQFYRLVSKRQNEESEQIKKQLQHFQELKKTLKADKEQLISAQVIGQTIETSENTTERYCKIAKSIIQVSDRLETLNQIKQDNYFSKTTTLIWFLGVDREKKCYWAIKTISDRIYASQLDSEGAQRWSIIMKTDFDKLLDSLDLTKTAEKKLADKIKQALFLQQNMPYNSNSLANGPSPKIRVKGFLEEAICKVSISEVKTILLAMVETYNKLLALKKSKWNEEGVESKIMECRPNSLNDLKQIIQYFIRSVHFCQPNSRHKRRVFSGVWHRRVVQLQKIIQNCQTASDIVFAVCCFYLSFEDNCKKLEQKYRNKEWMRNLHVEKQRREIALGLINQQQNVISQTQSRRTRHARPFYEEQSSSMSLQEQSDSQWEDTGAKPIRNQSSARKSARKNAYSSKIFNNEEASNFSEEDKDQISARKSEQDLQFEME